MATSGQVNTNTTYESYFWVKWQQVGNQDIPNNRTQIAWSCGVNCGHSFLLNAVRMSAVTINGTQVYAGGTYSDFAKGDHTIASGTLWIGHNTDGAKTFTISSFTGWLYSNHNYSSNGASYSLNTIPRHATLTAAPDFTDEQNPTITYSNPAGSAVSGIYACISLTGAKDDIAYREIPKSSGNYTFPLTEAERNVLRNATTSSNSRTVMFIVRSGISGAWSNSAITKTLSIVNANPTFTSGMVSYADVNEAVVAVTKNNQQILQNKSIITATVGEATANKGATIKEYTLELNGVTKTASTSGAVPFGVVNSSQDITLSVTAKDSRGNTTTAKKTVNVTEYSKPLVIPLGSENAIQCYRSDGNGNRISNSTSLWIKARRSYHNISGKNGCALQLRWKTAAASWNDTAHLWSDLLSKTNTAGDEYNALIPGVVFDLKEAYTVQIRAIDDIGEYEIKTFDVPTQDVALHLGKGGKNVSVGTYCDYSEDHTFYSKWKAIFDKEVIIGGLPVVNHIVEEGTDSNWTYRKWKSGIVELWGICKATLANGSVLSGRISYPFALTGTVYGIGTLNDAGGNGAGALPWNLKLTYGTDLCEVWVHNPGSVGFTSANTVNVSVYIVGRWK